MAHHAVKEIRARGCVLRGNEIDTDRIIPARFMKEVTFDQMGHHLFEDARAAAKGEHPLDDERFAGSGILIVEKNFGCGSSREHAPQALMRFGFRAFIGASFADIFFGNCTALGLPCIVLSEGDLENLMGSVELDPTQEIQIDIEAETVTSRAGVMPAQIPKGTRKQLLEGSWDATGLLLDAGDAIEATAAKLPYIQDFPDLP
jgi:3-isopropylmalate/(R)-2-methylmalate dehydratase small subunit